MVQYSCTPYWECVKKNLSLWAKATAVDCSSTEQVFLLVAEFFILTILGYRKQLVLTTDLQ